MSRGLHQRATLFKPEGLRPNSSGHGLIIGVFPVRATNCAILLVPRRTPDSSGPAPIQHDLKELVTFSPHHDFGQAA
jgi:hypothetical protein